MHQIITTSQLIEHLASHWKSCGVEIGDTLLVHSSLRRLLRVLFDKYDIKATPEIVYESLVNAVGEKEGTLILPLFNFDFPKAKVFDIRNTPSQMGALTEISRTNPASVRTGHPIYSFSVRGKFAPQFANINNQSGYGDDSPFALIKQLNGKIAVIGLSDQDSMTSYHFVEEQNKVDYRYFKAFQGLYTNWDGETEEKTYSLFVRDIERGVTTDVNRMMEHLWRKGLFKGERHDEGYGMRTIDFNAFYAEVEKTIQAGEAINYLYSIQLVPSALNKRIIFHADRSL